MTQKVQIRRPLPLPGFVLALSCFSLACAGSKTAAESPSSPAPEASPVEGLPDVPESQPSSSSSPEQPVVARKVGQSSKPAEESLLPTESGLVRPEKPSTAESTGSTRSAGASRQGPPGLLAFLELGLGERAADLGTGSGFTPNRMSRTVGRTGVVFTQRELPQRPAPENETVSESIRREAESSVVVMEGGFERPFSPEATDLHLVTFLFGYHKMVESGVERREFNRAVFDALRPGGLYVVAEYDAPPGSGVRAARERHEFEERLVKADVLAAGFELLEAAELSSSPAGEASGDQQLMPRVRSYVLKFRKPR